MERVASGEVAVSAFRLALHRCGARVQQIGGLPLRCLPTGELIRLLHYICTNIVYLCITYSYSNRKVVLISRWLQFFGALRDTFNLCDKHLKRNENDEEYLSVSDRNTLLSAIVGLAGCVTFTGVAREEKYGELCKLALEKLEPVVAKLSGAGPLDGAPQQFQQQFQYQPQQPPPPQQQQYFARQQTPQQQPQYVQSGGYHSPGDYWSRGQEGGQAQGGGYYGQMGWQTPWPWPGQMCQPYTPQPQLQQPPPGHQYTCVHTSTT